MKLTILFLSAAFWGVPSIVIRHDKSDLEYQNLARQFEKSICHLNLGKTVPDGEGTMIRSDWVLTAAHCAIEIQKKLKRGDEHLVTVGGELHRIDSVLIHEQWAENEAYDIALLHLETSSSTAQPVDIYTQSAELNKMVYVVGLGDTGDGLKGISRNDGRLRAATNRVDEATDFWLKWTFDDPVKRPEKATELEGISGPGDSGGPAFIIEEDKTLVVGVSSAQSTRNSGGEEGVYGVMEYYTRVSKYTDWINKRIN